MLNLNRIRVGPRLAAGFAILALATLTIGFYGINRLANLTESLTLIGEDRLPKVAQLADNVENINLIARELRNTLIFDDPAKVADALKIVRGAQERAEKAIAPLSETITSESGRKLLASMTSAKTQYLPLEARFIRLIERDQKAQAESLLSNDLRPAQLSYFKAVDELNEYQMELVQTAVTSGHTAYTRDRNLIFGLLVVIMIACALIAIAISRSIILPLRRAVVSAERIAEGDLCERLVINGRDETSDLLRGIAKMQESLRTVVGKVRTGVESVRTASQQIADSSMNLSTRTENQALDLHRTVASMEEITGTVHQTASNAGQADESAKSASTAAIRGGEVVRDVVTTMNDIKTSSSQISDIVGTIDDIAFKTNILALNAAVEAARAGEQGRGFAVVASEVRNLAQNSAKAAKEISELIADSSQKVLTGGKQVTQAGEAMDDIVKQVHSVTGLVGNITVASREQSQGIGEVNQAISKMDQATQQNAAMSEESAAASQLLSREAENLAEVVAVFNLDRGPDTAVSSKVASTPTASRSAKGAPPQTVSSRQRSAGIDRMAS
ncbi:MAG: methyl-accepting chemotaxis protein [Gammaproteobacteria bacterium]